MNSPLDKTTAMLGSIAELPNGRLDISTIKCECCRPIIDDALDRQLIKLVSITDVAITKAGAEHVRQYMIERADSDREALLLERTVFPRPPVARLIDATVAVLPSLAAKRAALRLGLWAQPQQVSDDIFMFHIKHDMVSERLIEIHWPVRSLAAVFITRRRHHA